MVIKLRKFLANIDVNRKGWKTDRKIVVIESDDWGSIRMPSVSSYNNLLAKGIPVDRSPYCKFDTLASAEDLSALFEVLRRYKDRKGNHPVITANTVVCNPDFDSIKKSGYAEYHYEKFTYTLKRYYTSDVFSVWKHGISEGLFYPQFHGREHVNANLWLQLLRNNHSALLNAFNEGCWGLSSDVLSGMKRSVQASFDYEDEIDLEFQKRAIKEGLAIFEEIFGYRSSSFIANNFIWDKRLERELYKCGVNVLQGMKYQKLPIANGYKRKMVRHWVGERNKLNQIYLVRNCSFEPSLQSSNFDNIQSCLRDIKNAFYWNKPAIITSHRINFVGFIDEENRDRNLHQLDRLLKKIVELWPEVEFMTSNQLGDLISVSKKAEIFS